MLRRLLVGLVKGSLVGGLFAYLLVAGLSLTALSGGLAYAAVVLTGVATALVAGRPIWAAEARIEVLLKSIAAALLASGLSFLVHRYLSFHADLGPLGSGKLAELPYVLLPAVSTLLAVFFELDNDGDSREKGDGATSDQGKRLRVGGAETRDPVAEHEADESLRRAERR